MTTVRRVSLRYIERLLKICRKYKVAAIVVGKIQIQFQDHKDAEEKQWPVMQAIGSPIGMVGEDDEASA